MELACNKLQSNHQWEIRAGLELPRCQVCYRDSCRGQREPLGSLHEENKLSEKLLDAYNKGTNQERVSEARYRLLHQPQFVRASSYWIYILLHNKNVLHYRRIGTPLSPNPLLLQPEATSSSHILYIFFIFSSLHLQYVS